MSTQLQPPGEEKQALRRASTETPPPITPPVVMREYRQAPRGRMDLVVLWLAVFLMAVLLLVGVINTVPAQSPSGNSPTNTNQTANTGQTMNMNSNSTQTTTMPVHNTYNPQLPPVLQGTTVNVTLTIQEQLVMIDKGVAYHAWTFNGTVPGPIIHVRQGQLVHTTIVNHGTMGHSIDFHAAQTPWNVNYQEIPAGKSFTFTWQANYPGVFMYHCGTPTVIDHMANGMYGTVIVDPATSWPAAKEYALVQSEFYTTPDADGTYSMDQTKIMNDQPDYVVFNGYANQYKADPLTAKAGEHIRLYILNAGPSQFSAFHVIGAIFSHAYQDGNPANVMQGNQTVIVAPGGGMIVDLVIPEAGLYPFVTHSFADASKGALGVIKVTA